jgi:hypothetical protein
VTSRRKLEPTLTFLGIIVLNGVLHFTGTVSEALTTVHVNAFGMNELGIWQLCSMFSDLQNKIHVILPTTKSSYDR